MNLVWKGKFKNVEQLKEAEELPERANKFEEPDSLGWFLLNASIFIIPIVFLLFVVVNFKSNINGGVSVIADKNHMYGVVFALIAIIPHELLHAVCFPKGSRVEVWYSLKNLAAFVYCSDPMTKKRFVFMSFFPNLVLGFIPMIIWIFTPVKYELLNINLLYFAGLNILSGMGDYLNMYNAIKQVPKNGTVQNSGFNSYWYHNQK